MKHVQLLVNRPFGVLSVLAARPAQYAHHSVTFSAFFYHWHARRYGVLMHGPISFMVSHMHLGSDTMYSSSLNALVVMPLASLWYPTIHLR